MKPASDRSTAASCALSGGRSCGVLARRRRAFYSTDMSGERSRALSVVPIEERHVDAAARVLARAMDVDAGWRYLFPDSRRRERGLVGFFRRNLRLHLPHRCTYVGLDAAKCVVGTATVRPPGGINTSRWAMVRHGLLPFGLAHGIGAVRRLLWLKDTYEALESELAGGRSHWFLHMMAVDPDRQGRGLGSKILDAVLPTTPGRSRNVDTVLTTHLRRNLPFYERVGFRNSWERRLEPPDADPFTVWGMIRSDDRA